MDSIEFAPNVDHTKLSDYSLDVLNDLLNLSNNPRARITCLNRTPHEQAVVMHANLLEKGVEANREVYLSPGQQVIDVFVQDAAKSAEDTIADMEAKIIELGPIHVSRHCADSSQLQVVDLARSSFARPDEFFRVASQDPRVQKVLNETSLSCLHVQIPQEGYSPGGDTCTQEGCC